MKIEKPNNIRRESKAKLVLTLSRDTKMTNKRFQDKKHKSILSSF